MRGKHIVVVFVAAAFLVATATSAGSTPTSRVTMDRLAGPVSTTTTVPPPTTTTTTTAPVPVPPIGTLALTFDDGPSATYTPQVLDILRRYNVKATFFLVGAEVEEQPELVQRMLREGHHIGNHTWDHLALPNLDENGFALEVDRTQQLLQQFTPSVPCIRPPFGKIDGRSGAAMRARGLHVMRWTADSDDWKHPGVKVIVANLLAGAVPDAVLLLHDGGPDMSQTVAALPAVIEGIHARGLSIAPIC